MADILKMMIACFSCVQSNLEQDWNSNVVPVCERMESCLGSVSLLVLEWGIYKDLNGRKLFPSNSTFIVWH